MGIVDAFTPEARVELTYSEFYKLIQEAGKTELLMNAVRCEVPYQYIRETMTGKKESAAETDSEE